MTRQPLSTRIRASSPTVSGEVDLRNGSLRAIVALLARQAAREWVAGSAAGSSDRVTPSNETERTDHA